MYSSMQNTGRFYILLLLWYNFFLTTDGPWLRFFNFRVVWKWFTFSRNHASSFEFWPFSSNMCYTLSWFWPVALSHSSQLPTPSRGWTTDTLLCSIKYIFNFNDGFIGFIVSRGASLLRVDIQCFPRKSALLNHLGDWEVRILE